MSTNESGRFNDLKVAVTGASRGIGRVVVRMLAEQGADVVALARNEQELDTLSHETGCRTFAVDLSDVAATRHAASAIQPVDRLVNCAGITHLEPFVDTTVENLNNTHAVNVTASMILGQETARSLIQRGAQGAIVNVSSIAAKTGMAEHTAYCASKGALDSMMRVMAVELGPHGIRVNNVNPAVTLTDMAVQAWSDPEKSEPMRARIPLKRFIQPEEVASAVLYLLSDAAAMVHGVALDVDGGFRA